MYYGWHGISSSSKITQHDGRRARRYQKFPSECYFFLTLSLFQLLISELHFVLSASDYARFRDGSRDFVLSALQQFPSRPKCVRVHQADFIFSFWCKETLNPDEFFQKPSSNIPNMCLQEADGTRYTWSSDDRLLFNTILLWERYYCAGILQSFAGEFLMA